MKMSLLWLVAFWAIAGALWAQANASGPADLQPEKPEHSLVLLTTEAGEITIELFNETAPKHVESFLALTEKGFYNGLKFHRGVPGFVIQGGDPKGDGTGGPGYSVPLEPSERKHVKGILAMARSSDPNSAGSQFYICLDSIPHLDGQYTVFGRVLKGCDLPEKVKQGDTMKVKILKK